VNALTYTGTEQDRRTLLAEGILDPTDNFQVLTADEAAEYAYRRARWMLLKTRHAGFWRGYETATADAAAALEPFEPKPSLLRRLTGWF
jgi:hypothetical protein